MNRAAPIVLLLLLSACAGTDRAPPSLAPRVAEAIDPRLPVPDTSASIPLDAALVQTLAALVAQARSGEAPFEAAMAVAERAAASAGPRESESWVVAQEALSGAVAARYPVTRALGEVDALSSARVKERGGIAPADLAAIREAAGTIAGIDGRQAARIDALRSRLAG